MYYKRITIKRGYVVISKNNNKTISIIFLSLMMIMLGFLIASCSQTVGEDQHRTAIKKVFEQELEDQRRTAIKKVLEQEFTGPNEKLVDLLWNPKYRSVVNNKAENQELDKYLAEVYGRYFADFSRIEPFIAAYGGTSYQTFAYFNGYKLSLKNITIEQENISYRYTFIAKVGYQKNGEEEKTASVEGEVVFSTKEKEEGKILGFQYGNDNGLSDILNKAIK
jgi:hypothetical protein